MSKFKPGDKVVVAVNYYPDQQYQEGIVKGIVKSTMSPFPLRIAVVLTKMNEKTHNPQHNSEYWNSYDEEDLELVEVYNSSLSKLLMEEN